jgi:uncharacterized protein
LLGIECLAYLQRNHLPTTTLKSGDSRYTLQIAATIPEQEKGLGGRSSLPQNQGMLFKFSTASEQCFWMKNMRFPLDMIWVGGDKRVLFVKSSILPSTYPNAFCPNVPTKYVIELNSGQASKAAIHAGGLLSF